MTTSWIVEDPIPMSTPSPMTVCPPVATPGASEVKLPMVVTGPTQIRILIKSKKVGYFADTENQKKALLKTILESITTRSMMNTQAALYI